MSLVVLSTLLGFIGPFVPELIKWFTRKQDNAHELAMLKLQGELAEKQASYRLQEVVTRGELDFAKQDLIETHRPQVSFGVQLLDAAKGWPAWVVVPVFWAFAVLDWLNGSVRPTVTYWIVGFYLYYKWCLLQIARVRLNWQEAVVANWTSDDAAVLMMCLGYFFGQRVAKAAFGGSASTGRVGGG